MMATQPKTAHIYTPGHGHVENTNCPCEPTKFYWLKGNDGEDIYVVEHNESIIEYELPASVRALVERMNNADITLPTLWR